ncbi:MAG: BolA family transcriptional regulator [Gallionella sp.]|nr:BolA family transcriptional regulator [Gallionella sp.]
MSNRLEKIRLRLVTFNPTAFELTDDSHKHAGHAGSASGGGHYVLRIASAQFIGKNTIARHRMVYLALGDMMKQDIHALTIQALTPNEI